MVLADGIIENSFNGQIRLRFVPQWSEVIFFNIGRGFHSLYHTGCFSLLYNSDDMGLQRKCLLYTAEY